MDDGAAPIKPAGASEHSSSVAEENVFSSSASHDNSQKAELAETISALRRELEAQVKARDELLSDSSKMSVEQARLATNEHIDRLHRYNDIKDAGQVLFGKLAELQGKTVKEVYEEYGVDLAD